MTATTQDPERKKMDDERTWDERNRMAMRQQVRTPKVLRRVSYSILTSSPPCLVCILLLVVVAPIVASSDSVSLAQGQ